MLEGAGEKTGKSSAASARFLKHTSDFQLHLWQSATLAREHVVVCCVDNERDAFS